MSSRREVGCAEWLTTRRPHRALSAQSTMRWLFWSLVFWFGFVLGFVVFLNSPGGSVLEVFDIFLKHWLLSAAVFAFVPKLTFTALYFELLLRPLWHFHRKCSKILWQLILNSRQLWWEVLSTSLLSPVIYSASFVGCPRPWSATKHYSVGHCITCYM